MPAKYRAEQVGSLLRPEEVLRAHAEHAEGRLPLEELRHVEDTAILAALDLQRQVGIDVCSDGEYRRGGWASDFVEAVEGYVPGEPAIRLGWRRQDPGGTAVATQPQARDAGQSGTIGRVIGGRLQARRRLTAHESGFLKAHAPGPFKVTMPAASYVVARGYKPGVSDQAYGSRSAVLTDAAAVIRAEVGALLSEGVPYIQLDNPHYPDYIVDERREQMRSLGIDPDQALADDIAADNSCLSGFDRSSVRLAMHLCRGNGGRSGWHTQGGYDRIAEQVFGLVAVDTFLLEYDSERAGGFEPLRFMPKGKTVVLGLITTKAGELEPQDLLLRRIEEASKYVRLEDLALSPQCGFASVMTGNPLTWEQQRQKLELVVETARRVWG
ncbi:MAG: cobalamin-independent methionine synthase II family protein [Chloroflexota bacterium]|nr:cobalamin-independent methionine synthase II family protein [Chloroflexota bacterium]